MSKNVIKLYLQKLHLSSTNTGKKKVKKSENEMCPIGHIGPNDENDFFILILNLFMLS